MTFELNLDGVEAWKPGGVILRAGTHPVRCVDEEIDTKGDHPVVTLHLEAIGGEEKGGEIRDWIHVTEASLGKVAQMYEAFGVEVPAGSFKWIPVKGRQAKALVREEPKYDDPSKTVSKVKGYMPLSEIAGGFEATGASDDNDPIPF